MKDSDYSFSRITLPIVSAFIASASMATAIMFVFLEREKAIQEHNIALISDEIHSIKEQVFINRENLDNLNVQILKLSSEIRTSDQLNYGAEEIIRRLEQISAEMERIRESQL